MGETARPSEEALESFRKYIHFAKYLDYTISDEVSEVKKKGYLTSFSDALTRFVVYSKPFRQ